MILFLGTVAPWEIHALGSGLQPLLGFNAATHDDQPPARARPRVRQLLGARADLADASCCPPTRCSRSLIARAPRAQRRARRAARAGLGHRQRRRPRRRPVPALGVLQPDARHPARPARLPHALIAARGRRRGQRRSRSTPASCSRSTASSTRPLTALALAAAARVPRLQSGRLSAYLLYMLIALILALALIPILR